MKVDGLVESDDASNTAVFRIIVQESLTNAARHAKARRVEVAVARREVMVEIEVRDDGVGFDLAESYARRTHGILGMRERASTLGGGFTITTAIGKGTRIESWIPIGGAGAA